MSNVLFICNQNKHRSKTAEGLFNNRFHTRSAGLFNRNPVMESDISWADTIIVMEEEQRMELAKRFPNQYMRKRILNIDIPDIYSYNQQELKDSLKIKLDELDNLN